MSFFILRKAVQAAMAGSFLLGTNVPATNVSGMDTGDDIILAFGIGLTSSDVPRVGGKAQTNLGVTDHDYMRVHLGHVKMGMATSMTGMVKVMQVQLTNVASGDSGFSIDSATIKDLTDPTLVATLSSTPFVVQTGGRHLHVDAATGNNSNNGLTWATAWADQTPWMGTTAGKRAVRGDILHQKNGTYTAGFDFFGGQQACFDYSNFTATGSLWMGAMAYPGHRPEFPAAGSSNIKIFERRQGSSSSRDQNFFLSDMKFLNIASGGTRDAFMQQWIDNMVIRNNWLYQCGGSSGGVIADSGTGDNQSWDFNYVNDPYASESVGSEVNHHCMYWGLYRSGITGCRMTFNRMDNGNGRRGAQVYAHTNGDQMTGGIIAGNDIDSRVHDNILIGGSDALTTNHCIWNAGFIIGNYSVNANQGVSGAGDGDPYACLRTGGSANEGADPDTSGQGPNGYITFNYFKQRSSSFRIIYFDSGQWTTDNNTYDTGTIHTDAECAITDGGHNVTI